MLWKTIALLLFFTVTAYGRTLLSVLEGDDRFETFVRHLKKNDMIRDIEKLDTATVFAPTNEAFEERREEDELTYTLFGRRVTRGQLLYHVLPNAVKTKELHENELFETRYEQAMTPQRIKIGRDNDKITVNDVPIVEGDIEADKAVVHAIDSLLVPPRDLAKTMQQDEDLHEFSQLSSKADIELELQRANGYTIFATKDVFDGLNELQKRYLNHSEAKDDLANVLKHQIYDYTIYAGDFPKGEKLYKSLQGEHLKVVVDKDGKITVNGAKIVRQDILASNGVIHLLEEPILPEDKDFLKLDVRKALIGLNATKFTTLLEKHGLDGYLDANEAYTVLAPPNEAIDENTVPYNQIESWLKYHIVRGRYTPDDLADGQLLRSESSDHLGSAAKQRVYVHVTDQDRAIQSPIHAEKRSIQFDQVSMIADPVDADKSIVYPVSRSLMLPRDPLSQLPVHLDLSTYVAALYASGTANEVREEEGISLLAPTNKAFERLGILTKHLLQPDAQDKLAEVVRFHVLRDVYYANETEAGEHRVKTLSGQEINLNKTEDGTLYVRGSGAGDGSDRSVIGKVVRPDLLTANGVVHTIDRIQLPANLDITNRDLLAAGNTNTLLNLLGKTNLTDMVLDKLDKPYTILAPSDRAFAKLNVSKLLHDPEQLLRVVRLHVLPVSLPRMLPNTGVNGQTKNKHDDDEDEDPNDHKEIPSDGLDLPSMLPDHTVTIRPVSDGYVVEVKNGGNSADVVTLGRASHGGGVVEIDRVLLPPDQTTGGGLRWWVIMLIVLGVLLGAALLALIAYYGWRWYQSRREGYISLDNH